MESKEIQELAKKLKNEHSREWRRKNKDKVKAINQRYWLKKAKEFEKKEKGENEND